MMKLYLFKAFGNFIVVRASTLEDAIILIITENSNICDYDKISKAFHCELEITGKAEIIYEELA